MFILHKDISPQMDIFFSRNGFSMIDVSDTGTDTRESFFSLTDHYFTFLKLFSLVLNCSNVLVLSHSSELVCVLHCIHNLKMSAA